MEYSKAASPFYPDQPVPIELFVGRDNQVQRMMQRSAAAVAVGRQSATFIQGDYGIGKSSIARYVTFLAEREHSLHTIYVSLGGCRNLNELTDVILNATLTSGVYQKKLDEKLREWLANYIGGQELFGVKLNLSALKRDQPNLTSPFGLHAFLSEAFRRLSAAGIKGVSLVLDEINGLAETPEFPVFLKGFYEQAPGVADHLPLWLILCGTGERRSAMISSHQPVERIFDVVTIERMSDHEAGSFFQNSFQSVGIGMSESVLATLVRISAGLPKVMHVIGNEVYWQNTDTEIDDTDAIEGITRAAKEVGEKFFDRQVYQALRSSDYKQILKSIASLGMEDVFTVQQLRDMLTQTQREKLSNFLTKMKKLHVLRPGEAKGQYVFEMKMVQVYLYLEYVKESASRRSK